MPHLAGSAFDNVTRLAFRNIQRVLDGQPFPPADLVATNPGDGQHGAGISAPVT